MTIVNTAIGILGLLLMALVAGLGIWIVDRRDYSTASGVGAAAGVLAINVAISIGALMLMEVLSR